MEVEDLFRRPGVEKKEKKTKASLDALNHRSSVYRNVLMWSNEKQITTNDNDGAATVPVMHYLFGLDLRRER